MRMQNTTPNPLADVVYDELVPILDAIYEATDSIQLEGCRSAGIQIVDSGEYRTSTDAECCEVVFSLFVERMSFDARKPMFRQLADWLKQLADDIDAARAGIESIEGVRDVVVLTRKATG